MELCPANLLDTLLHKMIMGGVLVYRLWVTSFSSGGKVMPAVFERPPGRHQGMLMFGFTTLCSSRYVHILVNWFTSPDLRDDKAHHEGIRILGNLFTCSQSFVEFHFREQPSIHNPLT
jgi:hypothetical protein